MDKVLYVLDNLNHFEGSERRLVILCGVLMFVGTLAACVGTWNLFIRDQEPYAVGISDGIGRGMLWLLLIGGIILLAASYALMPAANTN